MAILSQDAPPPGMGPGFLRLTAWPYRAEWAVGTLALLLVLFYWRLAVVGDLDVLSTIFWILFPDLAAFIPIGVGLRGRTEWPTWGAPLYNAVHSLLVWSVVFAAWSWATGAIVWPLLGWAGHITADRAFGYYLRGPVRAKLG